MNKFKVGDKVEVIDSPRLSDSGGDWEPGNTFTIDNINSDKTIGWAKGNPFGVYFEALKLVAPKKALVIESLEVGVEVEVIKGANADRLGSWTVGDRYTTYTVSNGSKVAWAEGNPQGVYFDCLKIATGKPKKKTTIKITHDGQIVGQDKIKKHLSVAIDQDMPVLLVGDTGSGKTSIVRELAEAHGKQFCRFPITGETSEDDFVGKYILVKGETVWLNGMLINALTKGWWLVVDEINMALPEILALFQSLLDDDKMIVVSKHEGEIIKPHPDFRFFATMNPTDEYAGTKDLNKALKSRFNMIIDMGYPKADVEYEIVKQKTLVDEKQARFIVDFGQLARKAKEQEKIFYTCSTRDLIQWGKLAKHISLADAFLLSILNKANGDTPKMAELYKTLDSEFKLIEKAGYQLNIDYFKKEISNLENAKHILKRERERFEADVEQTTERIRKEVIESLVKTAGTKRVKTASK